MSDSNINLSFTPNDTPIDTSIQEHGPKILPESTIDVMNLIQEVSTQVTTFNATAEKITEPTDLDTALINTMAKLVNTTVGADNSGGVVSQEDANTASAGLESLRASLESMAFLRASMEELEDSGEEMIHAADVMQMEVDEHLDNIEELQGTGIALEELVDTLGTVTVVTPDQQILIESVVNTALAGTETTCADITPNVIEVNGETLTVSVEGISEFLKNLWESIKAAIASAWVLITSLVKHVLNLFLGNKRQITKLRESLAQIKGLSPKVANVISQDAAFDLSTRQGSSINICLPVNNGSDVIHGLEMAEGMNKRMLGKFYPSLLKMAVHLESVLNSSKDDLTVMAGLKEALSEVDFNALGETAAHKLQIRGFTPRNKYTYLSPTLPGATHLSFSRPQEGKGLADSTLEEQVAVFSQTTIDFIPGFSLRKPITLKTFDYSTIAKIIDATEVLIDQSIAFTEQRIKGSLEGHSEVLSRLTRKLVFVDNNLSGNTARNALALSRAYSQWASRSLSSLLRLNRKTISASIRLTNRMILSY